MAAIAQHAVAEDAGDESNIELTLEDYRKSVTAGYRGAWSDDETSIRMSERDGKKLLERV